MIRDTGCTVRGYLEIISQILGSFNLPSRFTSTSASANVVRSDFADAISNTSAVVVECKEFKNSSDSDASSLPLESVSASALAVSLEVLGMCKKID